MENNLHKSPEMLAYEEEQRRKKGKLSAGEKRFSIADFDIDKMKVPSLPAAAAMLIQMCQDLNVDYKKVGKVIQSDPGLSVRLLRIANSSYYGQTNQVTAIVRALTIIGLKEVKTIGLSYKLMNVIREFASVSFDFVAFWERSLVMGVLAKEMARELGSQLLDEAFLAGLLQDLGIVILRTNQGDEYQRIANAAAANMEIPLVKLEQHVFNTDHARIGADACGKWKFSKLLIEAIRYHHTPPKKLESGDEYSEIRAVAYAAGIMPDFLMGHKPMVVLEDLEHRGIINSASLEPIFDRAYKAFKALTIFFESFVSADAQIGSMMSEASHRLQKIGNAHQEIFLPPE